MSQIAVRWPGIAAVVTVCLAGCGVSVQDLAEQINGQSEQSQQDSQSTPATERRLQPAQTEGAQEEALPVELSVSPDQFDPEIDGHYIYDRGCWYGWNQKTNELHFVAFFRDLGDSCGDANSGQPSGYTINHFADEESFGIKFNSPGEVQIWGKPYSLRYGRVFLLKVRGDEAEVEQIREPIVYVDSPIPDVRIPKTVDRLAKRPRIEEFSLPGPAIIREGCPLHQAWWPLCADGLPLGGAPTPYPRWLAPSVGPDRSMAAWVPWAVRARKLTHGPGAHATTA